MPTGLPTAAGRRRTLLHRLEDEFRFLRGWVRRPRSVGSVVPTSAALASRMASVVDLSSGLPALEIGPGTGAITRALLKRGLAAGNLYAVEHSPAFVRHLRRSLPGVQVVEGDAFDLAAALGAAAPPLFDCVISSLPLLNFPPSRRVAYLEALLDRLPPGRPVVQFSYGLRSPLAPGAGSYSIESFDFIFRNIPPARLWIYRRNAD